MDWSLKLQTQMELKIRKIIRGEVVKEALNPNFLNLTINREKCWL